MPQIELITRASVTNTDWWGVLEPSEQRKVLIETQALSEAMVAFGMSRLAIGEHLSNIQEILEPKRKFVSFLNSQCRFSKASAYRYIEIYQATKDKVPELVLRTAIARGYDVLDAQMIEKLPPPKTQDRTKIVKYLEKFDMARKEERAAAPEPEYDPDALLKETLNFVTMRFNRLPNNGRSRAKWLEQLVGMMLSALGSNEERSFAPLEIPEAFVVVRGRPRIVA